MHWPAKSVPFEELASVPTPNTFINWQRDRTARSAVVTAANVHDKHVLSDLLHGNEQRVYGDSAYASQKALIASKAPKAKDFTNQRTRNAGIIDEAVRAKNRNK